MSKYVIVGNGTAAIGTVEGIRSADRDGDITVISLENHHVYCRPLISYYLEGKTDLERIKYRPDDFYEKNGCTVLYGRRAEKSTAAKDRNPIKRTGHFLRQALRLHRLLPLCASL